MSGIEVTDIHRDGKVYDVFVWSSPDKRRSVEELLGNVLVRTGRITAAQLQEALRIQRRTLQRLGFVLVKSGISKWRKNML